MPPLEWSMIESAIMRLILPGFVLAAILLAFIVWITRSDLLRACGASVAFIAGWVGGNVRSELIPLNEFETGWRGFFYALVVLGVLSLLCLRPSTVAVDKLRRLAIMFVAALIVTPYEILPKQPWLFFGLLLVASINWLGFDAIQQSKGGRWIQGVMTVGWGMAAVLVLVLCHSARFADLCLLTVCASTGIRFVQLFVNLKAPGIDAAISLAIPSLMLASALNSHNAVPNASLLMITAAASALLISRMKSTHSWFDRFPGTILILPFVLCTAAVGLALHAEQ